MEKVPMNLPEEKRVVRSRVENCLKSMSSRTRSRASSDLCIRIEQATQDIRGLVFAFLSMSSEVDIDSYLQTRIPHGVAVPVVNWSDKSMQPCRLDGLDDTDLSHDQHGLRTPIHKVGVDPNLIQAIIVPAVAYDESGCRLGRGGGFYDRFLERLPTSIPRIGVAFDEQIVEKIPVEPWDQRVNKIVTPTRTIITS